jgi:hypothetical protein
MDSDDQQLQLWVKQAIIENPNILVWVETRKDAPNSIINEVKSILKDMGVKKVEVLESF